MTVPLLFVSDSISASSGLGRITRDLATRVHEKLGDVYRIATAGYGGSGSSRFPWPDYHFHSIDNWLLPELPAICEDFAGDEQLRILFIWDASRLWWLGNPKACPIPALRYWVDNYPCKRWIYGAIDAEGPNGGVSHNIASTYQVFDRILDYSAFSSKITGNPEHLSHGIDTTVFYPRDHKEARASLIRTGFSQLTPKSLLIGIVATNQTRKNWQLGIQVCKMLLDRGHDVRVWCHTDVLERYWSLTNLTVDYGLVGRVAITMKKFTDEEMADMYSACDVTLGIGPEGFGFCQAESLACGVPCIAGSYGAQAEFITPDMLVAPVAYFYEGAFCSKRPVHDPQIWANRVEYWSSAKGERGSFLPDWLDWNGPTLWPAWEKWFREGL